MYPLGTNLIAVDDLTQQRLRIVVGKILANKVAVVIECRVLGRKTSLSNTMVLKISDNRFVDREHQGMPTWSPTYATAFLKTLEHTAYRPLISREHERWCGMSWSLAPACHLPHQIFEHESNSITPTTIESLDANVLFFNKERNCDEHDLELNLCRRSTDNASLAKTSGNDGVSRERKDERASPTDIDISHDLASVDSSNIQAHANPYHYELDSKITVTRQQQTDASGGLTTQFEMNRHMRGSVEQSMLQSDELRAEVEDYWLSQVIAQQEMATYQRLKSIQGICIPRIITSVTFPPWTTLSSQIKPYLHGLCFKGILQEKLPGQTLEETLRGALSEEALSLLVGAVWAVLCTLNQLDFVHDDPAARNFIVHETSGQSHRPYTVYALDFAGGEDSVHLPFPLRKSGKLCDFPPEHRHGDPKVALSNILVAAEVARDLRRNVLRRLPNRWSDYVDEHDPRMPLVRRIIMEDLCAVIDPEDCLDNWQIDAWLCREVLVIIGDEISDQEGSDAQEVGARVVEKVATYLRNDKARCRARFLERLSSESCVPLPIMHRRYPEFMTETEKNGPVEFIFDRPRKMRLRDRLDYGRLTWDNVLTVMQEAEASTTTSTRSRTIG